MDIIGKEILNYRIVSLIGKGGMGAVYLAEHKNISTQKAAIKVINAEMVNDFTRKMLKDEAEHLAGLHHHNIVSFLDFHIDKEGNIYLIMEYVEGVSLDSYIKNVNGLIVEDRICALFEPILDGVGYAHKKGILHRDIKPANIVIDTDNTPKILDFGIAKIINKNAEEVSDNIVMGTPSYMSPEQVKGEKLDERSDVYSLGVLLHQMLTGNAPYDTTTLTEHEINQKVVEEPLPRIRTYYKYVSDKTQAVVDKATAKNPDDRYQSCEEFKKALHNAIYPWKPKTWMKVAAAAVFALIIGAGCYIWDYNRTKVKYFKDYVEVWGVPQGIHKLSKKEVAHRLESYRMEYRQNKLIRLSHINSKGVITRHRTTNYMNRPTDCKYFYTADKKIDYSIYYDQSGKVELVRDYNKDQTVVIFRYADSLNTEKVLAAETITTFTSNSAEGVDKGRISRYLLSHDEEGHVVEIKYAGFQNTIVADADGLYGKKFKLDSKGRVVEEIFVNQDGEPTSTKYGLGMWQTEYNDEDDVVKLRYFTVDHKPSGEKGLNVPVVRNELDQWGNTVRQYYEDFDGNLVYRQDSYFAVFVMDIEDGLIVKQSTLDTDQQPTFAKEGYANAIFENDKNGFISSCTFTDPDGKPVLINQGYNRITFTNDSHGNPTEQWCYDLDGELTLTNEAYSGITFEYDSVGNQTKIVFYDTEKKPCELQDGFAGYLYEYNDINLVTSVTYLNKDLQPTTREDNVPIIRIAYDKRGNVIKNSFYSQDGEHPCLNQEGTAGWNNIYDENGNNIERNFFDTEGNPIMPSGIHYASVKYTYDDNGNILSMKYYDLQGKLTYVNGVAGYEYVRDVRGNILEEKPIGADGMLVRGGLIEKSKYDNFNNLIESSYYDKTGAARDNHKVHKYVYQYNSRNQIVEEHHYGTNGSLTLNDLNWASVKYEYDDRGNLVRSSYYGIDGKPCMTKFDKGWSSTTKQYDSFGQVIKQCYFGTDGKPTNPSVMAPVGISEYDKWGNQILIAAQDGKGNYILYPGEKWSILRAEYDVRSNLISTSYFDEKDKPVICSEKYHKAAYKYDLQRRRIEEAYFGTNGQSIAINGFHKATYKYANNSDNITEYALYGVNGKPVDCDYGFHRIVITYNKEGTTALTRSYYRANGTLLASQRWNGRDWELVQQQESQQQLPVSSSSNWKDQVAEVNKECPYDFGEEYMHLTMKSIRVTGDNDCEVKFVLSKHSKDDLSSEVMEALKQALHLITEGIEEQLDHVPYVTGKLYDKNGTLLYSVKI